MYTVNNCLKNTLIVKNSKFIAVINKINNTSDIKKILNDIKKEYPKATHYCYAYILDNDKKSSDDNEPSGTAGMPILNLLEKNNLNKVLCIVVRYFGGIKLGTGGLTHAYSDVVNKMLIENKNNFIELVKGYRISITIEYNELDKLLYRLDNPIVINKEFNEKIDLILDIEEEKLNILSNYNYEILNDLYIEKSR